MDSKNFTFELCETDNPDCLSLTIPRGEWFAEDFPALNAVDFSRCRDRAFLLDGKAPLWLYMFCALRAIAAGAKSIRVFQAGDSVGAAVHPLPSGGTDCPDAAESLRYGSEIILEYNGEGNMRFVPDQLPALLKNIPDPRSGEHLVLTGVMPNFLAAAAAVEARRRGWDDIRFWSPINPGIYRVFPDLKMFGAEPQSMAGPHRILGIVGDPNSGKSVFADLLETAGKLCGRKIWTYDCDYAAPTPKWFLQMLRTGRGEAGTALRKGYKRTWTPEAELQVAAVLQNLKRHAPLSIADLPGGNHPKNQPPECARRIPPGREQIMREVDDFIIIDNPTKNSGSLWRKALAEIGLGDRIRLTVRSESPEVQLSMTEDGSGHLIMTGLDRKHLPSEELCRRLWNAVVRALEKTTVTFEK